jgi:hypothetical protein
MDIEFQGGKIGILSDLKPGTFFVTRSNEFTIFGLSAVYSGGIAAVVLNQASKNGELHPNIVLEGSIGGTATIELPTAFLAPSLSLAGLHYSSTQREGPGALKVSNDKIVMRVARTGEGFFYLDVRSGVIATSIPPGVEIPRWSVKLPGRQNTETTLIEFDGPKPIP